MGGENDKQIGGEKGRISQDKRKRCVKVKKTSETVIMRLLPKSFLGEILCRDRACPCPNPNEDSHKGCPYINLT